MGLTDEQKKQVIKYRKEGYGYGAISRLVNATGKYQVRDYCNSKGFLLATNGVRLETTKIRITKDCEGCGNSFESLSERHVYCSPKCNVRKSEYKKVAFECVTCGRNENEGNSRKYCSEECKPKPREKETICRNCAGTFTQVGNRAFCTSECRKADRRKRNAELYEERVCIECNVVFEVRKTDKHKYCGTSCSYKSFRMKHKEFSIKLANRHNGTIIPMEIVDGAKSEVLCKCLKCGNEFSKMISTHLDRGCGFCSSANELSAGELKVREYLNSNLYNFKEEYTFDDLRVKRNLRYDFAIIESNAPRVLIEFDGRQHFEPVESWGGEKELLRNIEHDKLKDEYAKNSGIRLIRVKYTEKDIFGFLDKALQGGE